ncbi:MAG TPA: hypothetical protein VMH50_07805 [Thermoleophilia bacterium]|nr:hypothetical protein [Thermoleophilia bacterium]
MDRNRRKQRRNRLTGALALATVALATLVLASPAVARPILHPVVYAQPVSTPVVFVILAIAAVAAVALVAAAVVINRPQARTTAVQAAPRRSAKASRQQIAA